MKTFLLFILTFNAQDGALLDAHSVDDVPMTAEECLQAQQGRVSRTQDGKFQIWECRNTRYAAELTPVAATQEPTSVAKPTTRVLGAIVLLYCGEPVAIQIQTIENGDPGLMTLLAVKMEKEELAALKDYAEHGGAVFRIELRPDCTSV